MPEWEYEVEDGTFQFGPLDSPAPGSEHFEHYNSKKVSWSRHTLGFLHLQSRVRRVSTPRGSHKLRSSVAIPLLSYSITAYFISS